MHNSNTICQSGSFLFERQIWRLKMAIDDFRRQNLTSTDVRFRRLKSIPVLWELPWFQTHIPCLHAFVNTHYYYDEGSLAVLYVLTTPRFISCAQNHRININVKFEKYIFFFSEFRILRIQNVICTIKNAIRTIHQRHYVPSINGICSINKRHMYHQ